MSSSLLFFPLVLVWASHCLGDDASPPQFHPQRSNEGTHQDSRCMCKCPDVELVKNLGKPDFLRSSEDIIVSSEPRRSIYIDSSVTPESCDCEHVVLTKLSLNATEADGFCPRCKCFFQVRNLGVMKIVVIFVIWVISILIIYMGFLACLDPILNKKLPGINYREQHNDLDEEEDEGNRLGGARNASNSTPMRTYGSSVINRVGDTQNRWKQQVQEQRRNIYDRHNMLN